MKEDEMTIAFSRIAWVLLAAIAAAWASAGARAQDYPTRTIRAVVPFAPAGVMDLVARIVLERVGQPLGQQIVIDNRPGAGGTIAIDQVGMRRPTATPS
jgi:tripartite-type tricarboxylate transporter receptor subunit TctC